jgi:hypothetical protein
LRAKGKTGKCSADRHGRQQQTNDFSLAASLGLLIDLGEARPEHWSERLKLSRIATDWLGIASQTVKEQVGLGEFLERAARDRT